MAPCSGEKDRSLRLLIMKRQFNTDPVTKRGRGSGPFHNRHIQKFNEMPGR